LKKEVENIDKLPKATASNIDSQDLGTANFIYDVFQDIYEKYKRQYNSIK